MPDTKCSRRDVLMSMVAAGMGAAGASSSGSTNEAPQPVPSAKQHGDPLNVILIVLDTARRDRFTFHGYERDTTPFLAQFAEDAVLFDKAYTPSNWTVPAHGSLFTGLYPAWHGALSHKKMSIATESPTLPEVLGSLGYQTMNITGNVSVSNTRVGRGFAAEHLLLDEYPHCAVDSRSSMAYPMAVSWLMREIDRERPFFLYINSLEPHDRYDTLAYPFARRFLEKDVDTRQLTLDWKARGVFNERFRNTRYADPYTEEDLRITRDFYDANIAYLDMLLERFLGHLYERTDGVMDRTILIVTSDHGELLGEHGLVTHHGGMYQELCHIPLLVKFPGSAVEPCRRAEPVSLVDLPATLADALGLDWEGREQQQGLSWVGTLPPDRALYMEDGRPPYGSPYKPKDLRYTYVRAVLEGQHKYVWTDTAAPKLFDLSSDPMEQRNLATEQATLASRLHQKMQSFFQEAPFGPNSMPDTLQTEEDRQALEALGYL